MKKILFIFIAIVLFQGCNRDNDDTTKSQFFNPPTWIQGTWASTSFDPIKYKFTNNDFISITATSESSNTAQLNQIKSSGGTVSVDEITNDNQYYFTIKMNNSNITYQFKKITSTQLLWVNHPSSAVIDIYLYKQ